MIEQKLTVNKIVWQRAMQTGQVHRTLVGSIRRLRPVGVKTYKSEMPVLSGFGKQSVKDYVRSDLEFYVTSKRKTSKGKPYLIYLHEGTRRLAGAKDYGFTTGRVRADDVAWGIGGIRPNKFADRAAVNLRKLSVKQAKQDIKLLLEKSD
jgi:hypothetical protein